MTNDRLTRIRTGGGAIGPADAEWLLAEVERLQGEYNAYRADGEPELRAANAEIMRLLCREQQLMDFLRSFISGGVNQDFKPWAREMYQKLYSSHEPEKASVTKKCAHEIGPWPAGQQWPACLKCEIERLRSTLEEVRSYGDCDDSAKKMYWAATNALRNEPCKRRYTAEDYERVIAAGGNMWSTLERLREMAMENHGHNSKAAEQPVATPGATFPGEDSALSPESSRPRELLAKQDLAYYDGARAAAAMAHQSLSVMDKWINDGCGGRWQEAKAALGASRDASSKESETVKDSCGPGCAMGANRPAQKSDEIRDLACCDKFVRESASEFCATCGYTNLDHLRKRSSSRT